MVTKLNYKDRTIRSYAIRKLTPFECFRLMGVCDDVIHIMQSTIGRAKAWLKGLRGNDEDPVISASQQYKQAGNSIVVDVLAAIYANLFYPPAPKPKLQLDLTADLFAEDTLPDMPPIPVNTEGVPRRLILTTFSGYDSQLMAADALREQHPDFEWECVGWSDIDKYACQMHNLVFPAIADRALGDITKIDWHQVKDSLAGRDIDLFTYSSPCQDISQAGKQAGLAEGSGSRSALLWHVADAIEVLRPRYLLQENVAALVSEKFIHDFRKWLARLESLGYINFWRVLNARDYGVPQNRERVFCLSMRRDVAFQYQWPEPRPLTRRLEDILETEVPEKFFLKDDAVSRFLRANDKDSALFVQFPIPPMHAYAMFLKTWLQLFIQSVNGWDQHPADLESLIEGTKPQFFTAYNIWKEQGKFPSDEFEKRFQDNMRNKK